MSRIEHESWRISLRLAATLLRFESRMPADAMFRLAPGIVGLPVHFAARGIADALEREVGRAKENLSASTPKRASGNRRQEG